MGEQQTFRQIVRQARGPQTHKHTTVVGLQGMCDSQQTQLAYRNLQHTSARQQGRAVQRLIAAPPQPSPGQASETARGRWCGGVPVPSGAPDPPAASAPAGRHQTRPAAWPRPCAHEPFPASRGQLGIHHRQLPLLPGPVPLSAGGKSASRLRQGGSL